MITSAIAVPHPPIIMPDIGKGEENKIRRTIDAYREAMRFIADTLPDTVVIISPHSTLYADYFHISPGKSAKGDFSRFGARSLGASCMYDTVLVNSIESLARKNGVFAGTQGEKDASLDHGTLIPLMFLKETRPDFEIVRIGISGLDHLSHYKLGMCIRKASELSGEKRVAIIASGDLSHRLNDESPYGFRPEGPQLDTLITSALGSGDFMGLLDIDPNLAEAGAECGLGSFIMMAGALDRMDVEAKLLSYEGPFGVGYAVAEFFPCGNNEARRFLDAFEDRERSAISKARTNEDAYIKLAREAVETYIRTGGRPKLPVGLPEEMCNSKTGTFVSIHKHGRLRGCMGTTGSTTGSIAEEIIQNAISASSSDPRFNPIAPDELDFLSIKVDVLMEPEDIPSSAMLDVKRYGVIVSSGIKRGLLLPDLEGVNTVNEQIEIARRKADIPPNAHIKLQRFEVKRHG